MDWDDMVGNCMWCAVIIYVNPYAHKSSFSIEEYWLDGSLIIQCSKCILSKISCKDTSYTWLQRIAALIVCPVIKYK